MQSEAKVLGFMVPQVWFVLEGISTDEQAMFNCRPSVLYVVLCCGAIVLICSLHLGIALRVLAPRLHVLSIDVKLDYRTQILRLQQLWQDSPVHAQCHV